MAEYINFDLKNFLAENKNTEAKETNIEESAPGYEHDCAAHVVHETHGYGVCIEGRHTLVETTEGKHEVTHYDVFFKNGETINNIPVNELNVVTSESHSHGKKKNEENIEELDGAGSVDALTALIGAGGLAGGAVALNKLMDSLEDGKLGEKGKAVAKFLRNAGKTFSGAGLKEEEASEELTKEEAFKKEIKDLLDS